MHSLIVLVVVLIAVPVAAQSSSSRTANGRDLSRLDVVRATAVAIPPTIDGRDDDSAWTGAARHANFQQLEPENLGVPSYPTEFAVIYDERNLYVHVRARDPYPDSIMRALTRRDVRGPSDQIAILIDSYHDRRTGYEFAVNPDGVRRDNAMYNDDGRDGSWNGVWEVVTVVDEEGWAAEFQIPLSQLRYADGAEHSFGFGVLRTVERLRETVSWPGIDRDRQGLVSQLGTVEGLVNLSTSRALELTPYTVAKNETRASGGAGFERANTLTIGADVKFRITPNVTIDATINPDFGQVEADPAVLNLTAVETFLSERRPFFVEGTGLYRFALNCYIVVDCGTNEGLFYSRRIGRSPTLRNEHGAVDTPASTPIAVASKVTGRTGGGLSYGLLHALTPGVEGVEGATVEPLANFMVVSGEQDFRNGDAGVRLLATGVTRNLDEWTRPYMHSSAFAVGLSGRSRLFGGDYEFTGSLAASRVAGDEAAIARTQRNAVHYFQQPGDAIEFDPTRTSLAGFAGHLKFGKYGGGITRFETSFVQQSAGFEVNDLGFLRRADQRDWSTWASLRFNNPGRVHRWAQFNLNHWQSWTTSGQRLQAAFNTNAHVGLHNNWDVHLGATLDGWAGSQCDRCSRGGPLLRRSAGFHPWFGVNTDNRRMVAPSLWVNLGFADEGRTRTVSIRPELGINASTALQGRIGVNIGRNDNHTQWVTNATGDDGITHHTFARLEQRTLSFTVRLSYTAAPDLTFEFYGEPFVSTGRYTEFRELSGTPDATSYDGRFVPYAPPASTPTELRYRQLRTNAVARWEFLPGSTLFVVWAHGRQDDTVDGVNRTWAEEYDGLFGLHPENTFLVKVAYWFSR